MVHARHFFIILLNSFTSYLHTSLLILIFSVHHFITGQTPSCLPKQTGVHPNKQMPGLGKHIKILNERRHSAAVASVLFVFSLSPFFFFFFTACLFSLCHTYNRSCTHQCISCLLCPLNQVLFDMHAQSCPAPTLPCGRKH